MNVKLVPLVVVALSIAVAGNALATTSSKSTFSQIHLCKDKLGAKGITPGSGKEYKTERAKCMENPTDYK